MCAAEIEDSRASYRDVGRFVKSPVDEDLLRGRTAERVMGFILNQSQQPDVRRAVASPKPVAPRSFHLHVTLLG